MTPEQFQRKWSQVQLTERSAAQQHFLDLCELVGHEKPAQADPIGADFTFERGAHKHGGGDGWADVWKRGFFGWEYKGRHADLEAAYDQLVRYREALENPPLLVVCDMERIIVHTNFTNTVKKRYPMRLRDLHWPQNLEILNAVFFDPNKLNPGVTREMVTHEAAKRIADLAQTLRDRGIEAHTVARFLDRIVFCLFAEDVNLIPRDVLKDMAKVSRPKPKSFVIRLTNLFGAMAEEGGIFGNFDIKWFNGNLFRDAEVLELESKEIEALRQTALLDWSSIDPSIFGTLFERGLDPGRRSQLGAHYTGHTDIETLVDPVVMKPLRDEWGKIRAQATDLLASGDTNAMKRVRGLLDGFLARLSQVKVLDPACGSGNFLYVTLRKMKDLEKDVYSFAVSHDCAVMPSDVGPWQFYGIEINPYAHELAQMAVWIGYLQWRREHGYAQFEEPILRCVENFECKDAIVSVTEDGTVSEPDWPEVDFIVGNPPFLGDKKMRGVLGDEYVDALRKLYEGRVPGQADLCCYWFEMARAQIEKRECKRAGLLATQGIRGGASREVLKRIKETGDIFFAVSDRDWILDGANVHVSLIALDDAAERERSLDGLSVSKINADLTASLDARVALPVASSRRIAFQGPVRVGDFDVGDAEAAAWLAGPNPHRLPNSDVLRPTLNGGDIVHRSRLRWAIDFFARSMEEACLYESPFEYARLHVQPSREQNPRRWRRERWWQHGETGAGMRNALCGIGRFVALAQTAKHVIFTWHDVAIYPEQTVIVFARDDDTFFGILHSRIHEVWARRQGTQLRERESGFRYTPTTCFETFPLPKPTPEQEAEIAEAARELDQLRNAWLNPPDLCVEEVLEFPGTVGGPWDRYIVPDTVHPHPNPPPQAREGVLLGTVRYPRVTPKNGGMAKVLAGRTLTALYNKPPTWLLNAHAKLDEAVFAAYGWPPDLANEQILERLLELNLAATGA